MAITTEEELGDALNNGQDTIEIEGDLSKKVFKIKSTGKIAWFFAIRAIGNSVAMIVRIGLPARVSLGIGPILPSFPPAAPALYGGAVSALGFPAAAAAVVIAVAAGGVAALTSLRKYTIVSNSEKRLVLTRK